MDAFFGKSTTTTSRKRRQNFHQGQVGGASGMNDIDRSSGAIKLENLGGGWRDGHES